MNIQQYQIPQEVKDLIEQYRYLDLGSQKVRTPYFINKNRIRGGLRSHVGKGTPSELTNEVKIYAKLRKFDLNSASEDEIVNFMKSEALGIDCSGFVSHALLAWVQSQQRAKRMRTFINYKPRNIKQRLQYLTKPVMNTNVTILTNDINSDPVKVKDAQPGDVIKLSGYVRGDHIVLIVSVEKDPKGKVTEITYVHSGERFTVDNGIREGRIEVIDQNKSLDKQNWLEEDLQTGVKYTYEGLIKDTKNH